jgi:hypothetical protein
MRPPLVAKDSRRFIALKMDSRVFSSAHTAARPPGLIPGLALAVLPARPRIKG